MSKKEDKVLRLYAEGLEMKTIARKLGYEGNAITKGIEVVKDILADNNIIV